MELLPERVIVRKDIMNAHTSKTVWTLPWDILVQRVRESWDKKFVPDEVCVIVPISPEGALCGYRPMVPGEKGMMRYEFTHRNDCEIDFPRPSMWLEVDELAPAQCLSVVLYASTAIKAPHSPELPAPHKAGHDWEAVAVLGSPVTREQLAEFNGQEPMAFSVMCYNQWASEEEGGSRREETPEVELKNFKTSWLYWRHMVTLKLRPKK